MVGFGRLSRLRDVIGGTFQLASMNFSGGLVALFSLEQIVNGLRHGFPAAPAPSKGLT